MTTNDIIVAMLEKDAFSRWLGVKVLEAGIGYCILKIEIRQEMCNGFEIAHGGITYSLADSALAFASNSHGRHALSIETSISHLEPCHPGDMLTAKAVELSFSHRIAIYEVIITNQKDQKVALFKGTVYRKEHVWK